MQKDSVRQTPGGFLEIVLGNGWQGLVGVTAADVIAAMKGAAHATP
jgi:hypothetical protein